MILHRPNPLIHTVYISVQKLICQNYDLEMWDEIWEETWRKMCAKIYLAEHRLQILKKLGWNLDCSDCSAVREAFVKIDENWKFSCSFCFFANKASKKFNKYAPKHYEISWQIFVPMQLLQNLHVMLGCRQGGFRGQCGQFSNASFCTYLHALFMVTPKLHVYTYSLLNAFICTLCAIICTLYLRSFLKSTFLRGAQKGLKMCPDVLSFLFYSLRLRFRCFDIKMKSYQLNLNIKNNLHL